MSELTEIDNECIRCGFCLEQQAAEGMPKHMCGELASEMDKLKDLSEIRPETYQFVLSCSLCDACTAHCPVDISCAETVRAARSRLQELQPELAKRYRPFRVDYRENLFSLLREAAGFNYQDALDTPPKKGEKMSLFLPGCSLSCTSEPLTMATYATLKAHDLAQGLSVYCCGKPLGDAGYEEAHLNYGKSLIASFREHGVARLITACPNCYYSLVSLFEQNRVEDIVITALPVALEELDISLPKQGFSSIAIHDSCPDRHTHLFARSTRALLGAEESTTTLREMKSRGKDTICCGVGGLSQVGGYGLSSERRLRRLRECAETGAECLVASCMSCVDAFVSGGDAPRACHYLELLFATPVDWHAAQEAFDLIYDNYSEQLHLPLECCTRVFND